MKATHFAIFFAVLTAPAIDARAQDHAAMGHGAHHQHDTAREPIPKVTELDRTAAFPPVAGHAVHDKGIHWFSRLNELETWSEDGDSAFAWEGEGWIGGDINRIWWRTDGAYVDDDLAEADAEIFYGRSISAWWDVLAGVRHDFAPDDDRTWAAVGVSGLAPYRFGFAATAYVGESGRTAARLEVEYELLFTNRLILQPHLQLDLYGKADEARGIDSGLSAGELGLRLRYEITRRFAPYAGVVYERTFAGTADLRRAAGEKAEATEFVLGLRVWF